jgi:CBS domain-containing protein
VEDDRVIGVVTLHDVKDISKEEWPTQTVARVMTPLSPAFLIDGHHAVFSALHQMSGNGLGRLLVMEGGKLVGILSQKDIARLFEIKEKLGKG